MSIGINDYYFFIDDRNADAILLTLVTKYLDWGVASSAIRKSGRSWASNSSDYTYPFDSSPHLDADDDLLTILTKNHPSINIQVIDIDGFIITDEIQKELMKESEDEYPAEILLKKVADVFYKENLNEINWIAVTDLLLNNDPDLDDSETSDFIEGFQDRINWCAISRHKNLSLEFIEKYKAQLSWGEISQHQTLSEETIERYKEYVSWNIVSKYQTLSEGFLKKFAGRIDWWLASKFQVITSSDVITVGRNNSSGSTQFIKNNNFRKYD